MRSTTFCLSHRVWINTVALADATFPLSVVLIYREQIGVPVLVPLFLYMENEAQFMSELDEAWYEVFGHSYSHCVQLSQIPGEIGQVHIEHIKYMERLAASSHESTDGQT